MRPMTAAQITALEERGLNPEVLERIGVTASDKLGGNGIAIPYFDGGKLVGRKHRTFGDDKRFMQDVGSRQILYNIDCLRDETLANEALIITEGECDAWAALQCGFPRVVSVPGGAPAERIEDDDGKKYQFLSEHKALIDGVREIILAVDGDGPGANLRDDLALRLGAARCKHVTFPKPAEGYESCKDLNDALEQYGEKGVQETLKRARPMPIAGYYELDELPEPPPRPALSTGMVSMDLHWKLRLGDLTVITGVPGHGKSALIDEVCCRMAEKHGWRTVFAGGAAQGGADPCAGSMEPARPCQAAGRVADRVHRLCDQATPPLCREVQGPPDRGRASHEDGALAQGREVPDAVALRHQRQRTLGQSLRRRRGRASARSA